MGWTERAEIKTDFNDIVDYIENNESFHDYRIGFLDYHGEKARITVEQFVPGERLAASAGLIWEFCFEGISEIHMKADCQLRFHILEVERGEKDGQLLFALDQGYIDITAEKISLGIPSPE